MVTPKYFGPGSGYYNCGCSSVHEDVSFTSAPTQVLSGDSTLVLLRITELPDRVSNHSQELFKIKLSCYTVFLTMGELYFKIIR